MINYHLGDSIINIKGVGKQKAEKLAEMGLTTILDIFKYFPYRYEDYKVKNVHTAKHGEKVTLEGEIIDEPIVKILGKKRNIISVKVIVNDVIITASWFNRSFLKNQLKKGRKILLTGKWDKNRLQIVVSESEFLEKINNSKKNQLVSVYSLPTTIKQNEFRKIIDAVIKEYSQFIEDYLPIEIIEKYKLYSLRQAFISIHLPIDYRDSKHAKRRLVYDELLIYQLRIQVFKKNNRENWQGTKKLIENEKLNELISTLQFSLTTEQEKVIEEILCDMQKNYAMNRLLQGDVGSGKTIVAILILYANFLAGYQGAFMVPTEVLAGQHEESLKNILSSLGIQVVLLTGKLTAKDKKSILGELQMGLIDVVVGTHALIQEDVIFNNLGLVIIDEQHRFGVKQRAILKEKGEEKAPDVLFMSATPIPRTLAITAYGDMDISTIYELPKGRKKTKTYLVSKSELDRVFGFMEKQINMGQQVYVVCPLIEESEKIDVQNAIDIHATLTQEFPAFNVGLMHARLQTKEKEDIITGFKSNEIQLLVSTTVIEVGVNIPNANLMIIYDAERFGLAQLHQLRGRVGRGSEQSYCILLADPKTENGKERMSIMVDTNDGFEVARRDLELRGPGDLLGLKQSGLPDFILADPINDFRTLEVAKTDAEQWINGEEFWENLKWKKLIKEAKLLEIIEKKTIDS